MVKKSAFHKSRYPIDIDKVNIGKIVIFNQVLFGKKGFKYFIGCKDDDKIKPLCIILLKMSGYVEGFDETKYMSFLIKDKELLEVYK